MRPPPVCRTGFSNMSPGPGDVASEGAVRPSPVTWCPSPGPPRSVISGPEIAVSGLKRPTSGWGQGAVRVPTDADLDAAIQGAVAGAHPHQPGLHRRHPGVRPSFAVRRRSCRGVARVMDGHRWVDTSPESHRPGSVDLGNHQQKVAAMVSQGGRNQCHGRVRWIRPRPTSTSVLLPAHADHRCRSGQRDRAGRCSVSSGRASVRR